MGIFLGMNVLTRIMIMIDGQAKPQMTLFTGSSTVANKLADDLNGKIKLEDAGFDWKILGPDVHEVHYSSYTKVGAFSVT